jgi:hypothetical protein
MNVLGETAKNSSWCGSYAWRKAVSLANSGGGLLVLSIAVLVLVLDAVTLLSNTSTSRMLG